MNRSSDFYKISKEIAHEFLLTAIVVDDRPQLKRDTTGAFPLKSPDSITGDQEAAANSTNDYADENNGHILEVNTVVDSFAERGIICSVITPREDSKKFKETLSHLISNSDIFILDWELAPGDNGEMALEILGGSIEKASKTSQQLRLAVIYTGEDIDFVIDRLASELSEHEKYQKINDFTYNIGSTRIVVYGKLREKAEKTERLVGFADIPDVVIEEFTDMTAGLVSNTVLRALSVIRRNTNKILSNFSRDLDVPLLAHRIMLSPKDKEYAEELLLKLIAEEFHAILEEESVSDYANRESIWAWLQANDFHPKQINLNNGNIKIEVNSKEKVLTLLTEGIAPLIGEEVENKDTLINEFEKKVHKKNLMNMFGEVSADEEKTKNKKFAHLTSNRTFYSSKGPTLTLGTIVKTKSNDQEIYLLSIMPRCDSVRIDKNRAFLFLPIEPSGGIFDIVLNNEDEFITFLKKNEPYDMKLIEFRYDKSSTGVIRASKDASGKFCFHDVENREYIWVSELRWAHAQMVAQKFANKLSRVGLDESEWLRRNSPR